MIYIWMVISSLALAYTVFMVMTLTDEVETLKESLTKKTTRKKKTTTEKTEESTK